MVSYLIWSLIGLLILAGLIGGFFQLMILSNVKDINAADGMFGRWVFNPENLNPAGRFYRKAIFVCWGVAFISIIGIFSLQSS
jgi:hypothetical protein